MPIIYLEIINSTVNKDNTMKDYENEIISKEDLIITVVSGLE